MADSVLDPHERRDWLRLLLSENVGAITFHQLIRRYGTAKEALRALPELAARGGLKRPIRLCSEAVADAHIARIQGLGAHLVGVGERNYPTLLRHIVGAPPLLCLKGDSAVLRRPTVAIVGSRNASALGRKFTRQLAAELGAAGFTVASGHARGIDTAAHEAALPTGTVGVLAGLDIVYPPENAELHAAVAARGILLTECMPGTVPTEKHFPRRNRLISGISYAVVVVEAAQRSGSLITARFALEQGREVFAVPGSPLDPRAEGANQLLREGAGLVRSAADVIEVLMPIIRAQGPVSNGEFREDGPQVVDTTLPQHNEDLRGQIVSLLGPAPVSIDDLIRETYSPPGLVLSVLLELELAGRLTRHPGGAVSAA